MLALVFLSLLWIRSLAYHNNNVAWYGGPVHPACEHGGNPFTNGGQYAEDTRNMIAIKAVSYNNNIYVITPRLRRGVAATVWLVLRGRRGPELEPYPTRRAHALADCRGIQNAVDFHLDYLGNLWVLDSGIVDTLEAPRCTCKPKVVVVSTLLRRVSKVLDLAAVTEPTSVLQSIVVEHGVGKPFVYISDASRGCILVHDTSSAAAWAVAAGAPAAGLQLALARRGPAHPLLVAVAVPRPGLLEIDTAALRRRTSAPRVFGAHAKAMYLLGSDGHRVFLRGTDDANVSSWAVHEGYNASRLAHVHAPGPGLLPTSATADPLTHALLVLDSNYADVVHNNATSYQRITFIGIL